MAEHAGAEHATLEAVLIVAGEHTVKRAGHEVSLNG